MELAVPRGKAQELMSPTDDDARLRILSEIQALRGELAGLRDRKHARDLKRQIEALQMRALTLTHVAGSGIEADTYDVVDAFVLEARAEIIQGYGTSAWDDPETVEEAQARMGTLPAAPESEEPITDAELDEIKESDGIAISSDQAVRLVAEIRRLRSSNLLADDELDAVAEGDPAAVQRIVELARHLLAEKGHIRRQSEQARRVDREERAELQRLRSDDWLQRAAEEWARTHDTSSSWQFMAADLLDILRKHRDEGD
jgi:hypothetical protein